MRMNEIAFEEQPPIDAYGGGGFRVGGERHEGSMALLPGGVSDWPVREAGDLDAASMALFVAHASEFDVLLLGLGPEIAAVPQAARAAIEEAGAGLEPMSTASACRTYNVLLSEGRRVAAALIAV